MIQQNIREFMGERREVALLKLSIQTKETEITNCERKILERKQQLEADRANFEQEVSNLEHSLQQDDKATIVAIINAENKAKLRAENENELRNWKAQLLRVKAEVSRNDTKLHEYCGYRRFLESLVSEPQKTERTSIAEKRRAARRLHLEMGCVVPDKAQQSSKSTITVHKQSVGAGNISQRPAMAEEENPQSKQADVLGTVLKAVIKFQRRLQAKGTGRQVEPQKTFEQTTSSDEDIGLDNFFQDPQELITALKDLEVFCLSLIRNGQDAEELFEELRKTANMIKAQSKTESENLLRSMEELKSAIADDEYCSVELLELCGNHVALDGASPKAKDAEFNALYESIADVYKECGIGKGTPSNDESTNPSPILMMAEIEDHLETLLAQITASGASLDHVVGLRNKVRAARRTKTRLEQREIERTNQEDRSRRAFLRAQAPAPPKKVRRNEIGRKMVPRSDPVLTKLEKGKSSETIDAQALEYAYFFT